MEGALPIMFLLVVLKVPVFFAIWLVWYGARSYDEFNEELPGGGEKDPGFRRWRREPRRPRGPRRGGPHGGGAVAVPDCPPNGRRTRNPTPASRPREFSRR